MPTHDSERTLARRSFFSKFGFGLLGGAAVGTAAAPLQAQSSEGSRFDAMRHAQDDWLDLPGKHRYIFDAPNPDGFGIAIQFTTTYYNINVNDYGLKDSDIAVVLVARHRSTLLAYSDAIWAKYGKQFTMMIEFSDPKTKQPPSTNLLNAPGYGMQLPNLGNTIDSVVKRGTRFAVCDMATHFFAGQLATMTKGNADAIYKELVANRIPNSHMVAAGVLAVNRAQEYGYTLLNTL
jgi:hypothetical protein